MEWNEFFPTCQWPICSLTSDAPGSIGYGALYRQQWFNQLWMPAQRPLSIAYNELFPVVIVAHLWGDQWANRRFCFRSDYSVVHILNAHTSRDHHIMVLIRSLLGVAANFTFDALHVPGVNNRVATALSSFQLAGVSPTRSRFVTNASSTFFCAFLSAGQPVFCYTLPFFYLFD